MSFSVFGSRYFVCRMGWSRIDPASVNRILLVSFSNLGDTILSLPVLRRLHEVFPSAQIDVLCGVSACGVFEREGGVRRVTAAAGRSKGLRGRVKEWKSLRAEGYDLVVDLKRGAMGLLGRYPYLTLFSPRRMHQRDIHLGMLTTLGIGAGSAALPKKETASYSPNGRETGGAPSIVIAPGSKSDLKRWPMDRFARVAERMMGVWGAQVIWIGDLRDRELIEPFMKGILSGSQNLAGQIEWRAADQIIRESALVLTNDSAPLHAADDAGIPVVSLFGPTDPVEYGSQRTPGGMVFRGVHCSPCGAAQCRYRVRECLDDLSVDEVWKKCVAVMRGIRRKPPESILTVRLDRLGDALLTYPALRALREPNPEARIVVLCRPATREVFERCRWVDEVWVYDYSRGGKHRFLTGYLRLIRQVWSQKFSRVYIFKTTLRANLLVFLSRIPIRVGLDSPAGLLLTRRIPDLRSQGNRHEAECAMDVARGDIPRGASLDPKGFEVFLSDRIRARELLKEAGWEYPQERDASEPRFLVIHPGSSCLSKRWPAESFAALAEGWKATRRLPVVVVGGTEEKRTAEWIVQNAGPGVYSLAGKTSIVDLAAVLKEGGLLVSNDSGPVHLAAAAGVPVVSIFGRTRLGLNPERWAPLGTSSSFVQKNIGCEVCLAEKCPIEFECLKQLTPEEVIARLRQPSRAVSSIVSITNKPLNL